MCGLVGMAGNIEAKHEVLFEDMLIVDSVRGIDSVGVAAIHSNSELTLHKRAMFPHDYLMTPGFREIRRKLNRVLIGHNRWATKGKVNNVNAHPFDFPNVVGAHNGTLRQQYLLPDSAKFDIDSENIFHSIDIQGIQKTYANIVGAAALVYFDKKQKSVNFIRNAERPFFYTYSKDRKTIFWASEDWMLTGLLKKHKIEHTGIVETQVDHHYELPMEGFKNGDVLDKMHIKKLRPYVAPKVNKTPAVNQKVHNFGNNKLHNLNTNRIRAKTMSMFPIGTSVKFFYNRGKVMHNVPYVVGYMEGYSDVNVRLFINSTHKDLASKLAQGSQYEFIGRINGYDKDGNMLVQANSVTAYKRKSQEKKSLPLYIDFGGTVLNKAEFLKLNDAAKDCCWCTSPIQFEEGNIILDDHNTVCKHCADEPELKGFIANRGGHF